MDYGDYYWALYRVKGQGSIPPFPTKHQGDEVNRTGSSAAGARYALRMSSRRGPETV